MSGEWKRLASRLLADHRIFRIREDRYRVPTSDREHRFLVLDSNDWVNVIALTADRHVVMIRQYRAGTCDVTLEIPGGLVESGETPLEGGRRELREESGYGGDRWINLGAIAPNPAIQSNRCWTFVTENATLQGPPQPDPGEEIEVDMVPLDEVAGLLAEGRITHALVGIAFQKFDLWQRGLLEPLP